jgi:uncharacterized OB-fold protein
MSETPSFCVESFYKFIGEGKVMAARCNECGTLQMPPRPICTNCYSTDLKWVPMSGKGELLTYTIIHVAPKQFEKLTPYAVGIVKLAEGPQLLGMIRNAQQGQLKIGMPLTIEFEKSSTEPTQWPTWPRYYFKP